MPKCPNCGQETLRTEDWACQWCGYPLLSTGYKKIDKTWKQIKEERNQAKLAAASEKAYEFSPEEPETRVEPPQKRTPLPKPAKRPKPEAEMIIEEESPPAVRPPVQPRAVPAPQPREERVYETPPPVVNPPLQPEPVAREKPPAVEREPEPGIKPVSPPPPAPVAKNEPAPAPEPATPPAAEPVIENAVEITADDLLNAYMVNDVAAHERFTNKILRVTGEVGRVNVNDMRAVYNVYLISSQVAGFRDVECRFTRQYGDVISRLQPGQTVTVQGRYFGYVINVILRTCTLAD